ncbi:MAG: Multicopper oxidase, type 3 [Betaproteobacteria bacterium]|nr:Multicopper oxidase, type 3 [Betaproteobacteria bacterium]
MRHTNIRGLIGRLARVAAAALAAVATMAAHAGAPGITGPTFALNAAENFISQPDGASIYSWGYGCTTGSTPGFAPGAIGNANCPTMQIPGPTLIVNEGDTVTVTLTNNLPTPAGNTSIIFTGFDVQSSGGVPGVLTREAAHGGTVTYTFVATNPGTHSYYSGTQGDLQVEMGLYGAVIVRPSAVPAGCRAVSATLPNGQTDFRLAAAAYSHSSTCYDREYMFQFSEIDPRIHRAAEEIAKCVVAQGNTCATNMNSVATEPYHPAYFMINGRSMPDIMDPNYAPHYAHQPYNGNPHMHPGELVLLRIIGQGRWQHPFHEHGNHVRILGRDGNLILSSTDPTKLAGPALFTTTTTPGQSMDGIFYWTGKGLNWDVYGHKAASVYTDQAFPSYLGRPVVCTPDANGYYTADPLAPNYFEWCQDHNKALESRPFGNVASGGPVTLPDANILATGPWYGGSAYLGPDATVRATGPTGTVPPSGTIGNSPTEEAGFAFMWHSHNEREITTNNIFPGGMLMMMLVDPQAYVIDESN